MTLVSAINFFGGKYTKVLNFERSPSLKAAAADLQIDGFRNRYTYPNFRDKFQITTLPVHFFWLGSWTNVRYSLFWRSEEDYYHFSANLPIKSQTLISRSKSLSEKSTRFTVIKKLPLVVYKNNRGSPEPFFRA